MTTNPLTQSTQAETVKETGFANEIDYAEIKSVGEAHLADETASEGPDEQVSEESSAVPTEAPFVENEGMADLLSRDGLQEAASSGIADAGTTNAPFTESADAAGVDSVSESSEDSLPIPILFQLKSLMQNLARDFETKLKYDSTKQGLIDKLYEDNQQYKDGILRKFQSTMILSVIEQIDMATKQIAFFSQVEFSETNFRKILDSYRDISSSLQDMLLEKFDVEYYHSLEGEKFDPKRQRALKTAPTGNSDLKKLVKQSLRPGYQTSEGQVLRPELVEVYVYDETLADATEKVFDQSPD